MDEVLEAAKADWIAGLDRAAVTFPIVFAPLGHLFEPYRGLLESCQGQPASVAEYLESQVSTGTVWLIHDAESVVTDHQSGLSRMRARAMEGADKAERLVLVSRWPRSRYPSVPGSSLVEDAKIYRANLLPPDTGGPESVIPLLRGSNLDLVAEFTHALLELGEGLLAALDHAFFEVGAQRPEDAIRNLRLNEAKELLHAGFLKDHDGDLQWGVENRGRELRDAISAAICNITSASPTLPLVFSELFTHERLIRRAIRRKASEVWGSNWRKQVLPGDLAIRVLERAQGDVYPIARSVAELRDPLEWLTFPELMEVRRRSEIGGLGLTDAIWRRLSAEVSPIRNRVAHMRLLRDEDLDVIRQWHRICAQRLTS